MAGVRHSGIVSLKGSGLKAAPALLHDEEQDQRDDEADVAFFSGVHAFFADFAMRDGTLRNAERFCCRLSRGFCTEIERELDIMKPKHVVSSPKMKYV